MQLWHALFYGLLQGVAELFPISSLGQAIIMRALLKWDQGPEATANFLSFLVLLHLATATALFIFFWKDWKRVIAAYIGSAKRGKLVYDADSKFAWLLVAGTIVVGVAGLVFEKKLRQLFEDPKLAWIVAVILAVNGVGMLVVDVIKKRMAATSKNKPAEEMTFIEGASVGATQTFALIPGISRSGATIGAGLLAGLSYEEAGRFSFMLATPVIGLAAIKELGKLAHVSHDLLKMSLLAAIVAGVSAYLSTQFLMHYFRRHRLAPFGWFCIVLGVFAAIRLKMG